MKNLRAFNNKTDLDNNYITLDRPTIALAKEEKKVFFPNAYFFKIKHDGVKSDRIFFCGAYADGDDCYMSARYQDWTNYSAVVNTVHSMYKFNYKNPLAPICLFKDATGEGAHNYELIYAGKTNQNKHMSVSWPSVNGDVTSPNYVGLIDGGSENPWANPVITSTHINLTAIEGERICPTSKLWVYNGYTYFAGYDYGVEGVGANKVVRRAYICRTNDFVNFESRVLLSVKERGSITSMSNQIKQVSEPDIVIKEDGYCYFVVRAVGDYISVDDANANCGYYYGEISNIEDYWNWANSSTYPAWLYDEDIANPAIDGDPFYDLAEDIRAEIPLKELKYVNTNSISSGGHLKGVLPRIIFNHVTNSPSVILYVRDTPANKSINQIYVRQHPLRGAFIKIGKSHSNSNNNSPQGGNMGVCVWKDSVFIACPHDRTDEVNIFIIPLSVLGDADKAAKYLPTLEDVAPNAEIVF